MHNISLIAKTAAGQGVGSHELALLLDLAPLVDDVDEWLRPHCTAGRDRDVVVRRLLRLFDRQWQPLTQRLIANVVVATHHVDITQKLSGANRSSMGSHLFSLLHILVMKTH